MPEKAQTKPVTTEETDKKTSEEIPEEEETSVKVAEEPGTLLGPEAVIMLFIAVLVDGGEALIELVPGIGQILSIAIDVFAVFFFGFWMWFRSGMITVPKKTGAKIAKGTAKLSKWAKRLKWLRPLCFIIELIPIGSSILPLWILVVYLELRHNTPS